MNFELARVACRPMTARSVCLLQGGRPDMKKELGNEQFEPLIFNIRGQRVLLDADLARLYGVDTIRFNEAFKRNRHRFPADFAFQLTPAEFDQLKSQSSLAKSQPIDSLRKNSSQCAMSSRRGTRYRPWHSRSTAP